MMYYIDYYFGEFYQETFSFPNKEKAQIFVNCCLACDEAKNRIYNNLTGENILCYPHYLVYTNKSSLGRFCVIAFDYDVSTEWKD